ncbi:MAG: hypothetical protein IJ105_02680 [Bacilli bacterium]|nr:hypothetical protein [Bacilli bacterium]
MKYEIISDMIIVYLYDKKYKNISINSLIINVFNVLKKYYKIPINNSYNIELYKNKYYGIILKIKDNDINYFNNTIDINLKILNDVLFLYEVDDPLDYINNEIYYYDNKFYINFKKINIDILENTKLIFGKEVYKIIGKGIKL